MKVIILYHPDNEYSRQVEEFAHDYQYRHGVGKLELLNVDGQEGNDTAKLYDVVQYPTILVIRDDGQLVRSWKGEQLPLIDEVVGYANA